MNQAVLIILCCLATGIFGALATWHFIGVAGSLGGFISRRRERKRLEAEARALKASEAKDTGSEKKKKKK